MDKRIAEEFLKKFAEHKFTKKEHKRFLDWLKTAPVHQVEEVLKQYGQFFESLPDDETLKHPDLIKNIELQLDDLIDEEEIVPRRLWMDYKMVAGVACMFLLIIAGIYLYAVKPDHTKNTTKLATIIPGGNKAILTLANGSKVILDNAMNGIIAHQGNFLIHKGKNGELLYNSIGKINNKDAEGYNTITTPNGGEYQVVLPDGSKVWLNAASSLKFPATFKGKERRVELTGEAYFEVAKNKAMPFRVIANKTQIEVLGTHFNVTAYKDEKSAGTTTTLLEGSVKIINGNKSRMIKPGEQAKVNENINVSTVNVTESIEWKNGNFNFSHENFESIMKKIARWYNVDIEYQDSVTREGFVGTVPRSKDISEVLRRLELTGLVHFKIVERRIIVMP